MAVCLVSVILCAHVLAEEQPAAVPEQPAAAVEQPAAVPEQPATAAEQPAAAPEQPVAAAEQPAGVPEPSPQGILLNFEDAPLKLVLDQLSESAGLVVLPQVDVTGRVSVISRQPLSVEEAVALLNTVLRERGYAAVQTGRTLKIISLEEAKRASIPVRSGSNPQDIEPGDTVITQIIPLRSVDAVKLKDDISPLIPSYAQLSANASSNSLILTDTSSNIRRIVEIVQALDIHMSSVAEVKVFQLNYASAQDAARLLNEVFKQDTTTQQQRGSAFPTGRFFRPGGGQDTSAEQQTGPFQKVTAAADQRTNTVVVSAPPDLMKVVEGVMKDLDANPAAEQAVFLYPVKNAKAESLAKVLNDLFGGKPPSTSGATGQSAQGGARSRGGLASMFAQSSQATVQTAADLYGQVYVVADADSNSLLVMTASKNFDQVKQLLVELDRAVRQVLIKVLIAEVTHTDKGDLGTEFSVLNLAGTTHLESDTGPVLTLDASLSATLRAWQEAGKLNVLSRPYILASDNQPASITVGQEVPFIRNSRTTETGQTINTIEYEDIGIILQVTPHINPEGLVILDVAPEISTLTADTVPVSENVWAPVFAKRSAQSRVAIHDGQTIVIGGLMEDKKTDKVRKVPLLGDIPLLNFFFRRTVTESTKTELLIFLTPHVAQEAHALEKMSESEQQGSKIIPDAVAPGTFDEHMRGMRRGAATASEQ